MNAKYKSRRKATPTRIERAVLAKSRRRCTLCYGLNGDLKEKRGQIAHLDGNRSNNAESNLAWMCLDHHSLFDSTTKQHKNYTIAEVKEHRRRLYEELRLIPQHSLHRVRRSSVSKPKQAKRSTKITNSAVATGANISQTINSPKLNLFLPAPTSGTAGRERYDEWRELIDEIHESIEQMGWALVPLVPVKPGDERNDYKAGIRRGNRVLGNRILVADAIQKAGLKKDWDDLVQYSHSARAPHDHWQPDSPTMGGFDKMAGEFQEKLMRIARQDLQDTNVASVEEAGRPLVIPLRYGAAPASAGRHMMGHHGLVVANHGEPAYDVSVLTNEIQIGTSKLQLVGNRPTLTKADGDAFFKAGILESPGHGMLGNGLFDEMRRHHVTDVIVELIYKDAENRWYKTVGKIERDAMQPGGLSVRYIRREQTEQPDESTARLDWPKQHGEYIAFSSEAIPHFPATLSGFRPVGDNKDFWNKPFPVQGSIRLHEGNDWEGIPKFPHTMNGCSHGVFMIRWRSAHPETLVRSSVRYSSKSAGADEKVGAFGYMSGTNCEQPMFKLVETPNGHTLVDLFYELKFWQAAP